jgi:hypothetical protein
LDSTKGFNNGDTVGCDVVVFKQGEKMANDIRAIIKNFYLKIKEVLPFGVPVYYSGIKIAKKRVFTDKFFPSILGECENKPRYEETLLKAISRNVLIDSDVVVIGGGVGVTAIKAATVARNGRVMCYEGDQKSVSNIVLASEYAKLNNLKIVHAIVQEDIGVYGATQNKSNVTVKASDIPRCDILELDCEGAEINILKNLVFYPNIILVETHGFMGASTESVHNLLVELGYAVTNLGVAEPDLEEFCVKNDVKVLEAVRN